MESNNNDYVLVLEDRTEVKNEVEVGKLSVFPNIDEKGKLKPSPAEEANQSDFLKFNSRDGLLKNFMENFLKQFNEPKRFGLYKVLADNVEQGVANLKTMRQNKQNPDNQQKIKDIQLDFEDYLPQQKNATAINPERVDWKMLEPLGLSKEKLEQNGELDKMLNWQKTNLLPIAIPVDETTIHTARLAFRTDEEGKISLAVHSLRKEPQLDFPYMGHKFSNEEKENLLATGNLGKTIEVTPSGEPFSAYVSIDPQTNEVIALRADRVSISKEIKGVIRKNNQSFNRYRLLVMGKFISGHRSYSCRHLVARLFSTLHDIPKTNEKQTAQPSNEIGLRTNARLGQKATAHSLHLHPL